MVTGFKFFWKALNNFGLIKEIYSVLVPLISTAIKEGHLHCDQVKVLLDSLRKILESGLVDLPGVDEQAIASGIAKIEENLVCSIVQQNPSIYTPERVSEVASAK